MPYRLSPLERVRSTKLDDATRARTEGLVAIALLLVGGIVSLASGISLGERLAEGLGMALVLLASLLLVDELRTRVG